LVGLREGVADLREDPRDAGGGLGAIATDQLLEVEAVEQLHGEVALPVVRHAEVIDAHRVDGAQAADGARLLEEAGLALGELALVAPAGDELEGGVAGQEEVTGAVDLAHAA